VFFLLKGFIIWGGLKPPLVGPFAGCFFWGDNLSPRGVYRVVLKGVFLGGALKIGIISPEAPKFWVSRGFGEALF